METSLKKKIILVGDKVLVSPEKDQEKTSHGLYLPPGVKEKEKVQSGYIVKVGPGYPVVNPNYVYQEPWSTTPKIRSSTSRFRWKKETTQFFFGTRRLKSNMRGSNILSSSNHRF